MWCRGAIRSGPCHSAGRSGESEFGAVHRASPPPPRWPSKLGFAWSPSSALRRRIRAPCSRRPSSAARRRGTARECGGGGDAAMAFTCLPPCCAGRRACHAAPALLISPAWRRPFGRSIRAHRLAVQDVALSRRKQGFDSPWARHEDRSISCFLVWIRQRTGSCGTPAAESDHGSELNEALQ